MLPHGPRLLSSYEAGDNITTARQQRRESVRDAECDCCSNCSDDVGRRGGGRTMLHVQDPVSKQLCCIMLHKSSVQIYAFAA